MSEDQMCEPILNKQPKQIKRSIYNDDVVKILICQQ